MKTAECSAWCLHPQEMPCKREDLKSRSWQQRELSQISFEDMKIAFFNYSVLSLTDWRR